MKGERGQGGAGGLARTAENLPGETWERGVSWGGVWGLLSAALGATGRDLSHIPALNPPAGSSQEYNMYGWWVGELNNEVGIVPKEYLTAAYELEER